MTHMGITNNFVKLRSSGTPQLGEWNIKLGEQKEKAGTLVPAFLAS